MVGIKRIRNLLKGFTVQKFIRGPQEAQAKKIRKINVDFDTATKSVTRRA